MACINTQTQETDAQSWDSQATTPGASSAPSTGQKSITQIYTDWANHYLDKGKYRRRIQNLQADVADGVVISDIIGAVTGQKVADINRRPKTRAQILRNVELCLSRLRSLGVAVDDIQPDDVISGKLKPILGLFFQLSRHKQQQQQQRRTAKPTRTVATAAAARHQPNAARSAEDAAELVSSPRGSGRSTPSIPSAKSRVSAGAASPAASRSALGASQSSIPRSCGAGGGGSGGGGAAGSYLSRRRPAVGAAADVAPAAAPAADRPSLALQAAQMARHRHWGHVRASPPGGAVSVALVSPMPQSERPAPNSAPVAERPAGQPAQHQGGGLKTPGVNKPSPSAADPGEDDVGAGDTCSVLPMQPMMSLGQYRYSREPTTDSLLSQHAAGGYMSDTDAAVRRAQPGRGRYTRHEHEPGYMSEDEVRTGIARVTPPPPAPGQPGQPGQPTAATGSQPRQISSSQQWRRAPEAGRSQLATAAAAELSRPAAAAGGGSEQLQRGRRQRSATPTHKHSAAAGGGGGGGPPEMTTAAQSPNLKYSRSRLRKSAGSYVRAGSGAAVAGAGTAAAGAGAAAAGAGAAAARPASQASVSSAGSSGGLPPKDPEHRPRGHAQGARTKVKVSGSTQTTAELLAAPAGSAAGPGSSAVGPTSGAGSQEDAGRRRRRLQQLKSCSVAGAPQLSMSVRERLFSSGSASSFCTLPVSSARERTAGRPTPTDGSLSDSNYGTTGPAARRPSSGPAEPAPPPTRPSSAYTGHLGHQLVKTFRGSMTDAESLESVSSGASGAQPSQQRSGSLTHGRLTSCQLAWDSQQLHHSQQQPLSPRLSRSSSIRSTASEHLYAGGAGAGAGGDAAEQHLHRSSSEAGAPAGRAPEGAGGGGALGGMGGASGRGGLPSSNRASRDDDVHGSSLSLVSTASSLYSAASAAHEEKQAAEARRLRRELLESQEKVQTLTCQLTTNAHVVEAFEQSLTTMTKKLHQMTVSGEHKDRQIGELRRQLDAIQRAAASGGGGSAAAAAAAAGGMAALQLHRQTSSESLSSVSSACSSHSQLSGALTPDGAAPADKKKSKKKGWFSGTPQLRSSFGKAFSRRKPKSAAAGSDGDAEEVAVGGSAASSPGLGRADPHHPHSAASSRQTSVDGVSGAEGSESELEAGQVSQLRRQLREKDTQLTDMRLEALATHHQLDQLQETVGRLRRDSAALRADNERLQRLVASRSAASSRSSLSAEPDGGERPGSAAGAAAERAAAAAAPDSTEARGSDEHRLTATVRLLHTGEQCPVGVVTVTRTTDWSRLDQAVRRTFQEYLARLDGAQSLGIGADAVTSYTVGELTRRLRASDGESVCTVDPAEETPELMPWGYTVGEVREVQLTLRDARQRSVDQLVFDTLIPKPVLVRYVSMLVEHRRVILCGQSGTGKTHLAGRLAHYLVSRSGLPDAGPHNIETVTVEPAGGRQLHQYLCQLADRCQLGEQPVPHVLVLDQLQHVQPLEQLFAGLLSVPHTDRRCPYIIGTMWQPAAAGAATALQLRHNFRWLLCANHVEPVRGFLGRHLRRRLATAELAGSGGAADRRLRAVFEWLPKLWLQLNRFLETHSSADVTMGPRLLMNCPAELTASQVWFTGVWNYSIVPYLVETVRDGLLIYGRRASWTDPTQFVLDTYPWPATPAAEGELQPPAHTTGAASLTRLRPEDVGYDTASTAGARDQPPTSTTGGGGGRHSQGDPLLSMLFSLQQAAASSGGGGGSGRAASAASSPDRPLPGPPEPAPGRSSTAYRRVPAAGQATL